MQDKNNPGEFVCQCNLPEEAGGRFKCRDFSCGGMLFPALIPPKKEIAIVTCKITPLTDFEHYIQMGEVLKRAGF